MTIGPVVQASGGTQPGGGVNFQGAIAPTPFVTKLDEGGVVDADMAALDALYYKKGEKLALTQKQAKGLYRRSRARESHTKTDADKDSIEEGAESKAEHGAHAHGHAEKPASMANALASAIINFLLMFGLCSAYGMIMFIDDWNKQHRGLGIKMNIGVAFFSGMLLAGFSKVPVAIGGPDLNPVVFIGGFVQTMAAAIAANLELDFPTGGSRRLHETSTMGRMLADGGGSSSGPVFCDPEWQAAMTAGGVADAHRRLAESLGQTSSSGDLDYNFLCEEYHAQLRATTIFATAVSSALLGVIFLFLGKFKLSRYVSYVPTSVQEAFLSCIGYKVFKYALVFCNYELLQFIPAACVGVPLYFLKAYHIGNPAIVMPTGILVPLGIFYAVVYGQGMGLDGARDEGWMFPEIENTWWTSIWTDGVLEYKKINTKAWLETLPELIIMLIVVVLDCMLKISSTETKLPIKTDKNYEISLYGAGNFFSVIFGQSVGYMQLKFNVINYGVLGNVKDRRAGMIYAFFCGVVFFGSSSLINVLPRLFLGSLLFFAGAGFVCENLWGSRKYLNFVEWLEILIILGVFILTGKLLAAVGTGVVLTGLTFIRKYAAVPAISGKPLRGAEVATHDTLGAMAQKNIQHIANSWLLVTKLRGYVFFASVQGVTSSMIARIEEEMELPEYQRMKYAVLDCETLDGLDVSAAKAMKKLTSEAATLGVHVYFCSLKPNLVQDFILREIVTSEKDVFPNLSEAVLYIEELILNYCSDLQHHWVNLHQAFQLNLQMQVANEAYDPFQMVLVGDASRFNSPWRYCSRMTITKYNTVLFTAGEVHQNLYLVHGGMVGLFKNVPKPDSKDPNDWSSPIKKFGHGCFLNMEALALAQCQLTAIALQSGELVYWTQEQWWRMSREQPIMVRDILRAVMRQQVVMSAAGADIKLEKNVMKEQPKASGRPSQKRDRPSQQGPVKMKKQTTLAAVKDFMRMESDDASQERDDMDLLNAELSETINPGRRASVDPDGKVTNEDMMPQAVLPQDLHILLQEMEAAQSLNDNHFFDPVPDDQVAMHPPLSGPMQRDLHNSFLTYCDLEAAEQKRRDSWDPANFQGVGSEPDAVVPKEKEPAPAQQYRKLKFHMIEPALQYAGIFNTIVVDEKKETVESVTESEFLEIGHCAAMAKLSHQHVEMIRQTFKVHDTDNSNSLDLAELSHVFQQTMHPNHNLNVETVDGIAAGFSVSETGGQGKIDENAFIMIMSRYIKKHERRWVMLKGILEVTKKDYAEVTSSPITAKDVEMAVTANGYPELIPRIKEMLWAADWIRTGAGDGESLTYEGFVSALSVLYTIPAQPLPPPPRIQVMKGIKEALVAHTTPCGFDAEALLLDFRSVLDLDPTSSRHLHGRYSVSNTSYLLEQEDEEITREDSVVAVQQTRRTRIRDAFENPNSSTTATVVSTVTGILILVSVLTLIVQPIVVGDPPRELPDSEKLVWKTFEAFFTVVFSLELLVRFSVCDAGGVQTRMQFISTPSNITDFVAIIPGWIDLIFSESEAELRLLRIIRMARISRMARVARLARKSALAAPVSMVLVVIWGIYMKHHLTYSG